MTVNPYLVGRVAVQLILVNGPTPDLTFSPVEDLAVRTATNVAFGTLGAFAKANTPPIKLQFGLAVEVVTLVAAQTYAALPRQGTDFNEREAVWQDSALTSLGQPSGATGLLALAAAGRGGADHSFVMLVSKYNLAWQAYARPERATVYVDWNWLLDTTRADKGWGPLKADRVIAHEIGHIFRAPDEFRGSGTPAACSVLSATGTGYGQLDFPNFNCEATNPAPVTCLMRSPDHTTLCPATRAHWGWVDGNGDGIPDVLQ